MTKAAYAEWIGRGHVHRASGQPVDAMLCFRHASRADPAAPDSHFHLGEVLWQLGLLAEAISAWRDAMRRDSRFLAPVQALAEALLATGDAKGAREAAHRVLTLAPGDARARYIAGVAGLLLPGKDHAAAAARVSDALAQDAGLVAIPTLAGPLALAVERLGDAAASTALLECLTGIALSTPPAAAMPAQLLALVCERAAAAAAGTEVTASGAAPFAAACSRSYVRLEHEALRRIAHAATGAAPDAAPVLARSYAELCIREFAPVFPLVWPHRTAGERLRVVALFAASSAADAGVALATLVGLPREEFDVAVAFLGEGATSYLPNGVGVAGRPPAIALPPVPDANDAKRLAALDPDVIVDLVGLAAAVGPLLAQRPARAIATPADLAAANVAPLVDRTQGSIREIRQLMDELRRALPAPGVVPDVTTMASMWESAVRTHQQGDLVAASEGYARVLDLQPRHAPAHYLFGIALRDGGDSDGARAQFAAAIAAAPRFVDARVALAKLEQVARRSRIAATVCAEGLAMTPDSLPLHRALGLALLDAHDGEGAEAAFAAALVVEPTDAETHYNHGVALQMQHKTADAERAYQRALAFRPDLTAANFNLGALFQEQGATAAAIAAYESVLKAEPTNAAAYKYLGEVLFGARRIEEWFANFTRFERHCPDALSLAAQALVACQYMADLPKLEGYLEGLRSERFTPRDEGDLCDCLEEILYLLLFFDVDPGLLLRFGQTYDATARRIHGEPPPARGSRKPGRLRIGYLSPDMRNHVMGKMLWQAVEFHDRTRFELYFYSLSTQEDDWTARFRELADGYENLALLSDRAAARRIAAADLDILVDAAGHTRGAKPGVLALKPARVQVTHVGTAGTVGLSAVDFKLTDRYADVPENQDWQIETLLPMDGCVYPYRHVPPAAEHPFHRAQLGIPDDAVVIGAFVTGLKLSRRCLALWRDVLTRIPRAKLAFSPVASALRPVYGRIAAAAGIAKEQILFLPQGRGDEENQARYEIVDFVLDPMPYGGVNGTLEALDMGVPVVTLVGKRHGERSSYSILTNLGVSATVAQTGPEYVGIAVRLAEDAAFMRDVRAAIRAGLARSPLTDRVAHTRALERAYVAALAARAPDALAAAGPEA
jgi:predicted O-linked N-acetylglucosamine transferase (SPINDLY family)